MNRHPNAPPSSPSWRPSPLAAAPARPPADHSGAGAPPRAVARTLGRQAPLGRDPEPPAPSPTPVPSPRPASAECDRRRAPSSPAPTDRGVPDRQPDADPRRRPRRPSSAPTSSSAASPATTGLVPGPARGPEDAGRRDRRDDTRSSPARATRSWRAGPRCPPRSPTARGCSGMTIATASRRWTCRASSSRRRQRRLRAGAARPGRLHADPVPDGRVGPVRARRRARHRVQRRGRRSSTTRSAAPTTTTSCRRSSSTGRPGAPRSATRRGSRAGQRLRGHVPGPILDASGTDPRRRAGHGDLRHRLLGHVRRRRSPTRCAQAQWGTLRVYDLSAKDGTPENVTEYPVWLTP